MRLVVTSLVHRTRRPGSTDEAHLVQDLLWAHAHPHHGLEHIRARPSAEGIDIALFVRAATEPLAADRARRILAAADAPLASRGYAVGRQPA